MVKEIWKIFFIQEKILLIKLIKFSQFLRFVKIILHSFLLTLLFSSLYSQ